MMNREKTKVLVVFGTRPEAIKLAPVIRELRRRKDRFRVRVCITAQHREMLDQVLSVFGIRAHHDLNIMRWNQTLEDLTSRVVLGLRPVLLRERPSLVMVQGDTTTTFAAALASFYRKIPVVHIEAGLRTGDFRHPYPEEMNRVLTSHLAAVHCAPTKKARENLVREGVERSRIHVTGNTVVDALHHVMKRTRGTKRKFRGMFPGIDFSKRIVLITGHRRESFGEGFRNICGALRTLARREPGVELVYPVHLNPEVQAPVRSLLSGLPNVHLLPPLEYEPFVWLLSRCYCVLTDSGGVQEEAPALGKPVLVMRRQTERGEGPEAGTARLVGTDQRRIVESVTRLLRNDKEYRRMSHAHSPYGDGKASRRISRILLEYFP